MALSNFVILLVSVWLAKAEYSSLQWSVCGTHPNVTLQRIDVTPMPIELPGPLRLTAQGSFGRPLDSLRIELSVKRKNFLIDIPMPCLMHLGSCTYESSCSGTSLLDTMIRENWAGVMSNIGAQLRTMVHSMPGLNLTACPVPPATINLQQYTINLPALPSILSVLAAGDYSAHVIIRETSSGETLLCLDLGMTLKRKEETCTGLFCG